MTNEEILAAAMRQSAIDENCSPEDYLKKTNTVVISKDCPEARKYRPMPFFCNLTTYGNGVVASVSEEFYGFAKKYVEKFRAEECFETLHLLLLQKELQKYGMDLCTMEEYFLPDINCLRVYSCKYETRFLTPEEFKDDYLPEWSNALCEKQKELDVMACAAFDGEKLIGLAGCSADAQDMWQINIDVLPEYRQCGIASALTSRLTAEIFSHGKIPFYCAAWSNIRSIKNALHCGYKPAWIQLSAKSEEEEKAKLIV